MGSKFEKGNGYINDLGQYVGKSKINSLIGVKM